MDMGVWRAWLTDLVPVLPSVGAMGLARHLGWALVCAALVWRGWFGLGRLSSAWRGRLAVLGAVLALVPGPLGLSYWLGLAFQTPSLSSMGLALWVLLQPAQAAGGLPTERLRLAWPLSLGLIVLGWVLMLDTLAMWPVFITPLGYGHAAWLGVLLLCLVLVCGASTQATGLAGVLLIALFVLTRLPSGNLWDALLDPWLWLYAHVSLFKSGWQARQR